MKTLLYSLTLGLFLFGTAVKAQESGSQIESVRAAFITQKLDLTTEESQKFWPVYNNYQHELQQLVSKKNQQRKLNRESDQPVDELKVESDILDLRKRYKEEFQKVLPSQKAAMVYPAEREFRQQLIEHLKSKKQKN
ncbi:MAG TPA: hypothetical protein VF602_12460 [Pedobacter sp.]|jgi:uncharacterized membrane protein